MRREAPDSLEIFEISTRVIPSFDWGNSDFDVRHRFVISPIWETPGPRMEQAGNANSWVVGGSIYRAQRHTLLSIRLHLQHQRLSRSTTNHTFDSDYAILDRLASGDWSESILGLSIPGANDLASFNSALGLDDFGPFPANMIRRNAFRGPRAWNTDLAVGKSFSLTERVKPQFRAEGFDIFNHHNSHVKESALSVANTPGTIGGHLTVVALKRGLNRIALGGNHDERRFDQFSLRINF
jgi:hypothetical protein